MRRIDPSMPREVAQRILWEEHGDLKARWMLNNLAEELFNTNERPKRAASATLIHAAAYLTDREEYTHAPWPKNMIKLPAQPICKHPTFTKQTGGSDTPEATNGK